MFGAPPVGHVMDPQFKPLFVGGLWKYVCECKYVVVSTQLVAWQKDTSRICMLRTTMSFGGASVYQWKT